MMTPNRSFKIWVVGKEHLEQTGDAYHTIERLRKESRMHTSASSLYRLKVGGQKKFTTINKRQIIIECTK